MRWKFIVGMFGCIVVFFAACGTTPQQGSAALPTVHPHIETYSATVRVQSGKAASVFASCPGGKQMLGGGFTSSDLFEYAAYIEASYPSGSTTWTVTGFAPSFFDLEAEVYCSSAGGAYSIQTVQATGTGTASIACPQGTTLLNGGFQSTQPVGVSHPQGNGWMSEVPGSRVHVFALCAARNVLPGQVVSSVFNAYSASHTDYPGNQEVGCPAGQIAVGGGFAGGDLIIGSEASGSPWASWSVSAGGDADVTVFALCVRFQA